VSARGKSRLHKLREALLVTAICGAMTFVLLEIALRLFAPQYSTEMQHDMIAGLWTPDPAAQYRNNPGAHIAYRDGEVNDTYVINSQGLREDHEIVPPAPGTLRILAVGDSFTFGLGVNGDQTFAHDLNGLTAADGRRVEVINAGVSGYGTDNELAWLRAYGWLLKPDVVVLGFFTANDISDNMLGMRKTQVDAHGQLVPSDALRVMRNITPEPANPGPVKSVKIWLAHNSQAYVLLRRLGHGVWDWLFPPPRVEQSALFSYNSLYEKQDDPKLQAAWNTTFELLAQMKAEVEAHGAKLVVVALPPREQIEDADWQKIVASSGLPASDLQRDKPEQVLARWCAQTNTPLVNLLPGFQSAPANPPLYYRLDTHFNAAGHTLAAQLIHDALVKYNLLK
jgi:lysophospholipase L1-like esterase